MVEYTLPNLVNFLAFLGLTITTYTIFYVGKSLSRMGLSFNVFTLALGVNLIGLSHLFRIWTDTSTSPIVAATISAGTVFLSVGVIWVFYERNMEFSSLRKREGEIKDVVAKLKDKYYQQELSEEELKSAYSGLLRELAEIEVKLSNNKK